MGALMTRAEVAELLGVHPRTVARMVHRGEIPSALYAGRRVYPRAAITEMIDDLNRQAQASVTARVG